jgi:hypothetical protein
MDEVEGTRKIQTNLGLCEGVPRRAWRGGGGWRMGGKKRRMETVRKTGGEWMDG